jgi:hypothetical protein
MAEEPYHSNPMRAQTAVFDCFSTCLQTADHVTDVRSIAIPAISAGLFGMDAWSVSHAAVQALLAFDAKTVSSAGDMVTVEFVCLDLSIADAMSVVFRQELAPLISGTPTMTADDADDPDPLTDDDLPPVEDIPSELVPADVTLHPTPAVPVDAANPDSVTVEDVPSPSGTRSLVNPASEWHDIKQILKHKRSHRKDFYLVDWAECPTPSWVERKHLTDYALQRFYASRPPRRKRRSRTY